MADSVRLLDPAAAIARESAGPERRERALGWLLASALVAGFVLRAPLYFARPSLLLDEARLALNIASRSWWELTQPLDYDQTAPLLFLWVSKFATVIGGVNEYTLRALPFVASVLTLPLIYAVARRVGGRHTALLAVSLAAVSPVLLQYVRQVKPYTLEALVGLGLLWLALDLADQPGAHRPARRLALAGAVAVWASTTAIFVIVGLLAVLWLATPGDRPCRRRLATIAGISAASFLPAYWFIYRPAAGNGYMQQFWQGSLLTVWEPGVLGRAWQATREIVWQTFSGGSTEPPIERFYDVQVNICVLALLLLGIVGARRLAAASGRLRTGLVFAPILVALGASLAGRYPIAARVMMFAVPALLLAVSAGAIRVAETAHPRYRRLVAGIGGACLFGLALPLALNLALAPREYEDVRTAVREYESRRRSDEPVYVFATALPAWTFYTTDWNDPDRDRLQRMARLGTSGGAAFENAPPRGRSVAADEGQEMHYPFASGSEALGLYHGAQWRSATGPVQMWPDTNWIARETARVLEISGTTQSVWILATRTLGLDYFLFRSVRMCEDDGYRARGVLVVRLVPAAPDRDCQAPVPLRQVNTPGTDDRS